MAKKISERKPLFGNIRSHACNATKHAQKVNFQKATLEDGSTVVVSTREKRTLKKNAK
jgi:ribosomal protein L28